MKRRPILAIFLILLIVSLSAPSLAKTATPTPKATSVLPFSGGPNSISGTIYDASGNGVAKAKVTLYYAVWVGNEYKAKDPFGSNENPQYSSDGSASARGMYVYTGVPSGVYVLAAEKGGISVSEVIMVTGGTTTKNLFIQGLVEEKPTSTPTPTSLPTIRPTPNPGGEPSADGGNTVVEVIRVLLMGLIGLQFIAGVVIIALQAGKKK